MSLNRQATKNQTSIRSSLACRELTVRSVAGQMCKQLWTIGLIGRKLVILLGVTQPNPTDHTFHLSDSFSGILHSQSLFKSWASEKHLLLILPPWSLARVAPAWKVLAQTFASLNSPCHSQASLSLPGSHSGSLHRHLSTKLPL